MAKTWIRFVMTESENNEVSGIEKRKFIRFPFTFPIKHRPTGEGEMAESQSDNISLGGVMFFANVEYSLDQALDIEIHYTASETLKPFSVKAQVRWIQTTNSNPPEYLVGVKFIDLSQRQTDQIQQLVDECVDFQSKMDG